MQHQNDPTMSTGEPIGVLALPLQLLNLIGVPCGSGVCEGEFNDGHDVRIESNIPDEYEGVGLPEKEQDQNDQDGDGYLSSAD